MSIANIKFVVSWSKALGKLTSLVEEVKEAEVAFTIITIASLATSRRSVAFHFPP